ncbi:hypothetical protein G3I40_42935 [Streptomyces sp. SID14478]|uniref:hypothetical protein n=1 Tax=Streptomyces sp. SID14478 TaxID=2706073 RepID=UPI0013DFC722|nr:hypothetical protein [Streptomyces sp. SID14478]NEB81925.1 hypothetical protein [Streptomyces sp. SID14478]
MMSRLGSRASLIAVTTMALALPAASAYADAAPKNCNAQQKTVNRHQATVDSLTARFQAEQAKEAELYDDLQDATGQVDHLADRLGDLNDQINDADPTSAAYGDLTAQRDATKQDLTKAQKQERAAYEAWSAFKPDAELAGQRKKANTLLKGATTRLATCQNSLPA